VLYWVVLVKLKLDWRGQAFALANNVFHQFIDVPRYFVPRAVKKVDEPFFNIHKQGYPVLAWLVVRIRVENKPNLCFAVRDLFL
jgi:hypothetical protein